MQLVRHARRRSEIRIARLARWLRRISKLTLVGVCVAVPLGLIAGPRIIRCSYEQSRREITRIKVKKLAYEAYPAWLAEQPDRECPRSLHDLAIYMNSDDANDAWGKQLVFSCDCSALRVRSAGEDHEYFTADDVISWD